MCGSAVSGCCGHITMAEERMPAYKELDTEGKERSLEEAIRQKTGFNGKGW
jgi:hypothetical protein